MSDYTPNADQIRAVFMGGAANEAQGERRGESFDRWLAAHDAEVRAEADALRSTIAQAQARFRQYASQEAPTYDQEVDALLDISRILSTAAVRASVVAEEPEWEYGIALFGEMDDVQPWPTEERALRELQDAEDILIRRRKAGPWVPVKQEGADQ